LRPPVKTGTVSSVYGIRSSGFHEGTDIAATIGTKVFSTSFGKIVRTGTETNAGNFIIISHAMILQSRYYHLNTINVHAGQKVDYKTVIGTVGNSGRSSGPHLHFEIRLLGIPLPPYILCIPGRIIQYFGGYKVIDKI
jgi:murein DD-endopeptidase MepM/ murein hydrolase activator NlpD